MRVLTSRFVLGALVLGTLCLLAETAEGGPFRRRARNNNDCCSSYGYATASPCCGSGGYATGYQSMGYAYAANPCCPSTQTAYGYGGQVYGASGYYQPGAIMPAGGFPAQMPSVGGTGATNPANAEKVRITDSGFEPATLNIVAGTTVRWTNEGQKAHTVTSDKGTWGSGEIPPGGEFTATFTKAGTFDYHCKPHKDMKATIVVK